MQSIAKVHKIDNGFLLEDMTTGHWLYAKDASGVAELIIASAARGVLGIPDAQKEMFAPPAMGPSVSWQNHPSDKEADTQFIKP